MGDWMLRGLAAFAAWLAGQKKWGDRHPAFVLSLKTTVALCVATLCMIALCVLPLEVLLAGLHGARIQGDEAHTTIHLMPFFSKLWFLVSIIILPASAPVSAMLSRAVAPLRSPWIMTLLTAFAGVMIAGTTYIVRITSGAIVSADGDNLIMFLFMSMWGLSVLMVLTTLWENTRDRWQERIPLPNDW